MKAKNFENRPLAFRMRPEALSEFVGQEHILGKGKFLRNIIDKDQLVSLIFYGPPGTGKSTLAYIISKKTKAYFVRLNAVTSGINDIRKITEEAEHNIKLYGKRTILFVDEVHRFNKTQQDALLPAVEEGILIFIGATTENPFFAISSPLVSRSIIIEFKPLSRENLKILLVRALKDKIKGLGKYKIKISNEAKELIISLSDGDARVLLNILELSFLSTHSNGEEFIITEEKIEEVAEKRFLKYDKSGDYHYDIISAFIKSIRGSDPDAAVFWLIRMIDGGESPEFIARRMIILASEDIGMANPYALSMAVNAYLALERVGLPEAVLNLAQTAIYLSTSPKSNSVYKAILSVREAIKEGIQDEVPNNLKSASYKGAKKLKRGENYKYPHDFSGHYIRQEYTLHKKRFYFPSENGYEREIKKMLDKLRKNEEF